MSSATKGGRLNLVLSSTGLRQPHVYDAFRSSLGSTPDNIRVAIITTASEEWKDRNKHAVFTRELLTNDGFSDVRYLDVEHEDPEALRSFDAVFINGGNPFYLLHHLRDSGAASILTDLARAGRPIAAGSGGAMVLGTDLAVAKRFTPEMNAIGIEDDSALALVPFTLHPHHGRRPADERRVREFVEVYPGRVVHIRDDEAVVVRDGTSSLLGPGGARPLE